MQSKYRFVVVVVVIVVVVVVVVVVVDYIVDVVVLVVVVVFAVVVVVVVVVVVLLLLLYVEYRLNMALVSSSHGTMVFFIFICDELRFYVCKDLNIFRVCLKRNFDTFN